MIGAESTSIPRRLDLIRNHAKEVEDVVGAKDKLVSRTEASKTS